MKYRDICRWLALPLLLFTVVGLLLLGSACALPPTPRVSVSISPTSQTVAPEQTFTVDVLVDPLVDPATAIAGVRFDLSYDASLVTAISVTEGDLFNQGGCATFSLPGTIDNEAGTITGVVCVITTPGGAVSGAGTLATVTFIAGTTPGISPLNFGIVRVGDKEGHLVTDQRAYGSVTVE